MDDIKGASSCPGHRTFLIQVTGKIIVILFCCAILLYVPNKHYDCLHKTSSKNFSEQGNFSASNLKIVEGEGVRKVYVP